MAKPLPEPTVKWALFNWRGRLGRRSYGWGAALVLVIQIYIMINLMRADQGAENQMVTWGLVLMGFWLMATWAILAMTIKRLHDLNVPAQFALGIFVPMLGMLFVLIMMILPGSRETNEHGPPPFPKK